MSEYSITLFDNIHQRNGQKITMDVESICRGLTTPVHRAIEDKSRLSLWSPTIFNGTRSTSNAQEITMLVYDMDDGDTPFDVWSLFAQRGWTTIAHTSASHSPTHQKYRVIIPLAKPLPKSDWEKIWRASSFDMEELVTPKWLVTMAPNSGHNHIHVIHPSIIGVAIGSRIHWS